MASNHTPNYQLNQWEAEDKVVRADFNADNEKTDAALAALAAQTETIPKIVTGTYTGDGKASQLIQLGFTPRVVLVWASTGLSVRGESDAAADYGGLAVTGSDMVSRGKDTILSIQPEGFMVYQTSSWYSNVLYRVRTNDSGRTYHYFVIV